MTPDEEKEWQEFKVRAWKHLETMRRLALPLFAAIFVMAVCTHGLSVTQRITLLQGSVVGLAGWWFSGWYPKFYARHHPPDRK